MNTLLPNTSRDKDANETNGEKFWKSLTGGNIPPRTVTAIWSAVASEDEGTFIPVF